MYSYYIYGILSSILNGMIAKMIPELAKTLNVPDRRVINIYDALGGDNLTQSDLFIWDGVHPNDAGDKVMAQTIFNAIINDLPII